MAGAVGILFGLCVLSFTMGAALMYVVMRRREDAAASSEAPVVEPAERTWVERPAVEPVADDYDTRPIHRNPVMGLPQMEPALAALSDPVEPVFEAVTEARSAVESKPVPVAEIDAESVDGSEPTAEPVAWGEPVIGAVAEAEPALEPEPVAVVGPVLVSVPAFEAVAEAESVVEPEPVAAAEWVVAAEPVAEVEPDVEPEPVAAAEPVVAAGPVLEAEPVADAESAVERGPVTKPEPKPLAETEAVPIDEPEIVGAPRYDQDGDFDPPLGAVEAPESTVAPSTDTPEAVEPAQEAAATTLPPPATPQPAEQTTWIEREDFRQRYLRTFEEVRRKAGSN